MHTAMIGPATGAALAAGLVSAGHYANVPLGAGPTQYAADTPDAAIATAKTGNVGDRLGCGVIGTR